MKSPLRFVLFAALLTLSACGKHQETAQCDVSVNENITFSEPGDKIAARAFGEGCDKAVALYVITTPEGHPIWTWASPMAHAFGAQFDRATEEELGAFLAQWAQPQIARTSAAPAWTRDIKTPFDRATYEDVRARDLPMLCQLTGVGRETCIFYEPAAAAATPLLERDTAANVEQAP
jgi:hypothetical protein